MSAPVLITVWVCDECGYWRQEERGGRHQTEDYSDPSGRLAFHPLRQADYVLAGVDGVHLDLGLWGSLAEAIEARRVGRTT